MRARGSKEAGRRRRLRTPARKAKEIGFRTQTPGPQKEESRPGRRRRLRTPARKANKLGFRTQTPGREKEKRRPGRRRRLRTPARKVNKIGFRTQTPGPQKREKTARGPSDSPVLGALLSAYREVTGDDSRPISIGGGTYAKAMPNMVAFGPNSPAVFFFNFVLI